METELCICGAGTMGRGIALAVAGNGIRTLLFDMGPDMIKNSAALIEKELDESVRKKRISIADKENILGRIQFTASIQDCQAPLIIEAIIEKAEAKSALFTQLAGINSDQTIFATNTSSLSVTQIAVQTSFPERVIGLHFFNPANRMKLLEIIRTNYNSEQLVIRMMAFAGQLEKTAVICRDSPGFIVNHVARPFYLEALRLAEKQIAGPETIDRLMESAGFKMGPFHLMDLIGNDINYTVSSTLYEALGKPARLKPSVLQEEKLKQGLLGKKTGAGYFQYNKPISE
jgi:3-hydroxybutyryl-CoA dehydrogenase